MSSAACQVCSGPSNGICHFGVQCCRACASFFHRSIKERRKYTCRWGQQCRITNDEGLRNSCRACRLKRCRDVGMAEEKKRDRKSKLNSTKKEEADGDECLSAPRHISSASSSSPFQHHFLRPRPFPPSAIPIGHQPLINLPIPLTIRFDDSLRQYENGLRAFSVIEGISMELSGDGGTGIEKARLITNEEYLRADKGSALLIYAMLCQHLSFLRDLSAENRVKMLKSFCNRFLLLHRIQMTSKAFPKLECPFAIIIPGGLIDRNRLDQLFTDISDAEQREKIRICITERHFEFGKKRFQPLKIGQLEFAALVGILFWNTVENCLAFALPPEHINAQKEAIYGELFLLVSERCEANDGGECPQMAPIRFAKLLEMLHLLNLHTLEVDEMQTMAKIFMDLPDFWDEISLPA